MQITEIGSEELRKTYRVVIGGEDIVRATETELKALSSRVKIPGFRPGFVPVKVMQQRYGKSVQADVIKNVVTDATEKTIRDNKLRIALQPDVKVENYSDGGDLVFTLAVDVMPEVPEITFKDIAIDREVFDIADEAIDKALDVLAKNFPTPVALPAEAKAEQGHVVTMDFVGKVAGKTFEGGSAEGFHIELGSGRLIPGFEEQLLGVHASEKKEVKVSFPKDYFSKELAGKEAVFDVTVKEVSQLETPGIDDIFAKARGVENVAALRDAVRSRLNHEYGSIVRTRLKKRLFDVLEQECNFPLPKAMVQMEFDAIWKRMQQSMPQGEKDYGGKTEDEVKAEYHAIAERRVKLGILLAEIGRRQKLQVTRDEMSRAVQEQAAQFPGQEQAVYEFYRKNPNRLEEFRGPILEEKAVDWILSQVQMRDKKMTTKELVDSEESDEASAPAGKTAARAKPGAEAKEDAKSGSHKKKTASSKKKAGGSDND